MLRTYSPLLAALSILLAATSLPAQQTNYGLSPADSRPSLVTPPSAPRVNSTPQYNTPSYNTPTNNRSFNNQPANQSSQQLQPIESFPRANQSASFGTGVEGTSSYSNQAPINQAPSACECQATPTTSYQPVQSLSPAAYSSNYVPPPPTSPYYAGRVAYQRPVVYQQAVARPVVRYRPVAPVATATPSNYYLRPVIPVQNVPAGATIGRGVIGQPTVYVPGQPVRNFLRYLAP